MEPRPEPHRAAQPQAMHILNEDHLQFPFPVRTNSESPLLGPCPAALQSLLCQVVLHTCKTSVPSVLTIVLKGRLFNYHFTSKNTEAAQRGSLIGPRSVRQLLRSERDGPTPKHLVPQPSSTFSLSLLLSSPVPAPRETVVCVALCCCHSLSCTHWGLKSGHLNSLRELMVSPYQPSLE